MSIKEVFELHRLSAFLRYQALSRAPNQGDPAVRLVSGYRSLRNIFHLEKNIHSNRHNPNSWGGKVIKEELSEETSSWEDELTDGRNEVKEKREADAHERRGSTLRWAAASPPFTTPRFKR